MALVKVYVFAGDFANKGDPDFCTGRQILCKNLLSNIAKAYSFCKVTIRCLTGPNQEEISPRMSFSFDDDDK